MLNNGAFGLTLDESVVGHRPIEDPLHVGTAHIGQRGVVRGELDGCPDLFAHDLKPSDAFTARMWPP